MFDLLGERAHIEMLEGGKGAFEVRRRLVLVPMAPRLHDDTPEYLRLRSPGLRTTFDATAACEPPRAPPSPPAKPPPCTSVAVATATSAFCAPVVGTAVAAVRTFTHSIVAIAATGKTAASCTTITIAAVPGLTATGAAASGPAATIAAAASYASAFAVLAFTAATSGTSNAAC